MNRFVVEDGIAVVLVKSSIPSGGNRTKNLAIIISDALPGPGDIFVIYQLGGPY